MSNVHQVLEKNFLFSFFCLDLDLTTNLGRQSTTVLFYFLRFFKELYAFLFGFLKSYFTNVSKTLHLSII